MAYEQFPAEVDGTWLSGDSFKIDSQTEIETILEYSAAYLLMIAALCAIHSVITKEANYLFCMIAFVAGGFLWYIKTEFSQYYVFNLSEKSLTQHSELKNKAKLERIAFDEVIGLSIEGSRRKSTLSYKLVLFRQRGRRIILSSGATECHSSVTAAGRWLADQTGLKFFPCPEKMTAFIGASGTVEARNIF